MFPNSKSKTSPQEPPLHLQKIYDAREYRTFELVKKSIDELVREKEKVSLTSIVAKSQAIDPEGKGISISAIQRNEQANAYYKKHRSHKSSATKRSSIVAKKLPEEDPPRIKPDRDLARTRQRYLKLSKEQLVDRLLIAEQGYVEWENRWHQANDDLLTLRLMTEEGLQNQDQSMLIEALEKEREELKKQIQYLLNKLLQVEGEERSKAKKSFTEARNQANLQPNLPDVEF